ncbi:unnamed protein product, partial [Aphanomyces euteiches]
QAHAKQAQSSQTAGNDAPPKPITRRRVTDLELLYVVEFLEIPQNYNILVGKATKGKDVVGGQALTKTQ